VDHGPRLGDLPRALRRPRAHAAGTQHAFRDPAHGQAREERPVERGKNKGRQQEFRSHESRRIALESANQDRDSMV
jgi:hypothetical protein